MAVKNLGVVSSEPTGDREAPNQIDIFARAEFFIKAITNGGASHDERGAGNVTHTSTWCGERGPGSEIQGTPALFEALLQRGADVTNDARCNGSHQWVRKVRRESLPHGARTTHGDVTVDEPYERRGAGLEPRVARRSGTTIVFVVNQANSHFVADLFELLGIRRTVIHNDHGKVAQFFNETPQGSHVTEVGNDDGDVVKFSGRGIRRCEKAGIRERAREGTGAGRNSAVLFPVTYVRHGRRIESQNSPGVTARDNLIPNKFARRVQSDRSAERQGVVVGRWRYGKTGRHLGSFPRFATRV